MRLLLLSLAIGFAGWAGAADVEVTVEGVDSTGGTLMIGFYDKESDFRVKQLDQSLKIPVTKAGRVVAVAKALPPGVYAIAVIWDLNNNGILDTKGRFKRPTEPFGFSNNPKIRFGPPQFSECTVEVQEPGGKLVIHLKK